MKKHATGFIFFVLIFLLFAVGYAVFRTYPIPEIEVVDNLEPTAGKDVCFPKKLRDAEVSIVQAVADPTNRTIVLDLLINENRNDGPVCPTAAFSFYRVDGNGATLLRSEEREIIPVEGADGTSRGVVRTTFDWLGDLRKVDNLYVTIRAVRSDREGRQVIPFSRDNATPVLLIAKNKS